MADTIHPGFDGAALVRAPGLLYRLDLDATSPTFGGWVVTDERGVTSTCSVAEAASCPGAREYVVELTRAAVEELNRVARGRSTGSPRRPSWPALVYAEILARNLIEDLGEA